MPADMFDLLESDRRFEYLSGRFFDGMLSPEEDEEFVALLEKRPALAQRFLQQARTERAVAGLSGERLSDFTFEAAVGRSIQILEDKGENERFAREVIRLVRDGSAARSGRYHSRRTRRRDDESSILPLTVGAAVAAMFLLALLLALSQPAQSPSVANPAPLRTHSVDLAAKSNETPAPMAERKPVAPTNRTAEPVVPKEIVQIETPPVEIVPPSEIVEPEVPPIADVIKKAPEPAPKIEKSGPVVREQPAVANGNTIAIANIAAISNVKAVLVRGKNETVAKAGDVCGEGDVLRVVGADVSASDLPAGPHGVNVRLADGSVLWLKESSSLVFHAEGGAARPVLEAGELVARVQKQSPENNLIVRTKFGPEASVLGTVFHVKADPNSKRVELRVDEGKVQFSNKGEKRIVGPDEACVAEDGKAPGAAYFFRPKLATLSGTVIDKETGKPIAGAQVVVSPYAQRSKTKRPNIGAKTDDDGHYVIRGIYEGQVFVFATTDEGGAVGINGRGVLARTKLSAGENASLNMTIDKCSLALGRVYEAGNKPVNGCTVRLLPVNSDGHTMDIRLKVQSASPMDYAAVAIDGGGKYIAVVEKPGFVARLKNIRQTEMRPDRINNWPLEVQLSPSATLKGKVTNAAGVAFDAADSNDPRLPRTIITLNSGSGTQVIEAEADGTFAFDTNLDSGTYEIKVERFGMAPFGKRINLAAGQTIELPVALDAAKAASR